LITADEIFGGQKKIALIGLGYVGLPLAVAFAKKAQVVGFDISQRKIDQLREGYDAIGEVNRDELAKAAIELTSEPVRLREASFLIVTVPTPIDDHKKPDLRPIESASRLIGRNLTPGSIVVYESTVYPGVTEGICVPLLEAESGLQCGKEFKV
jgi:UDP-N-acetyl-D-galactosamine dehydrogenase